MKFQELLYLLESQDGRKLEVGDYFFISNGGKSRANSYQVNPSLQIWVNEDNVLHRLDGPAYIFTYISSNIEHHSWYKNGVEHRVDGPSDYNIDNEGVMSSVSYHINGRAYSKGEFEEFTKGLDTKEEKELLSDLNQTFD